MVRIGTRGFKQQKQIYKINEWSNEGIVCRLITINHTISSTECIFYSRTAVRRADDIAAEHRSMIPPSAMLSPAIQNSLSTSLILTITITLQKYNLAGISWLTF